MTSYKIIYDAFLGKIEEDKWCAEGLDKDTILADWENLLESSLPWFKFPRVSLSRQKTYYDGENTIVGFFYEDLNNQEIMIIATLMKWMWLNRTVNTWENIRVMYDERDFSQANLLHNFVKLLEKTEEECEKLQKLYSRSREDENGVRKPYQFSKLAGGKNGN